MNNGKEVDMSERSHRALKAHATLPMPECRLS